MSNEIITVKTSSGDRTIEAELIVPGIAIHLTVSVDGFKKTWSVTHVRSGCAFALEIKRKVKAIELARALADLGNWDQAENEPPTELKLAGKALVTRYR